MSRRLPLCLALASACAGAGACSASSSAGLASVDREEASTGPTSGGDAGAAADDASIEDANAVDADATASTVAFLRVAQLSTVVPAADFCVATTPSGPFRGPLLAQGSGRTSDGAGAPSIGYGQVSAYFVVTAGAFVLRLVPAGAASCAAEGALAVQPSAAGAAGGIALAPGAYETLLVLDAPDADGGSGPPTVSAVVDDGTLVSGGARLRAINALANAGPLDFGFGAPDGGFMPLITGVPFGGASGVAGPSEGALDPQGYLAVAPFQDVAFSAVPGSSDGAASITTTASVPFGAIVSMFAIGEGDAGRLVSCADNAPPVGVLSPCINLP